jgi:hypothetical protein
MGNDRQWTVIILLFNFIDISAEVFCNISQNSYISDESLLSKGVYANFIFGCIAADNFLINGI